MPTPTLRRMQIDDIGAVCEIEQEAFTTPWTAEAFYNELVHNQLAHYMIMEVTHEMIGYGGMWTIMDEAHMTNIALREKYRGRKLGELLLRTMMVQALSLGMKRMTLEVRVSNYAAQSLYEKLNFYTTGVRKGYYTDNSEDALIMWADLDQALLYPTEGNET